MSSGVITAPETVAMFENFKLNHKIDGKQLRAITFKIENSSTIVPDQKMPKTNSSDADWETFTKLLPQDEPRFVVYDLHYETADGRPQDKIVFIFWAPDSCSIKPKMLYASSKDSICQSLNGISKQYQANDNADLDRKEVVKKCLQV